MSKKRKKSTLGCRSSEESESNENDKEWLPGSEDVRERNKTKKRSIPGADGVQTKAGFAIGTKITFFYWVVC